MIKLKADDSRTIKLYGFTFLVPQSVKEEAQFAAIDSDGELTLYVDEPKLDNVMWFPLFGGNSFTRDYASTTHGLGTVDYTGDWKDSLLKLGDNL